MNEREEWEITLDHTDVAVRLENDWHGNYAAHTIARLTGVGIAQGPWRATPAAALRAIGINANPHLEPHNCADEIATLRELVRAAYYEGAMASGPGASEREWLCSEACKELGA